MALSFAASAQPRFDVASVKSNRDAGCQGRWDFVAENGAVAAVNAPLRRIISRAFNLTDDRISGPAWMESECYDIQAKVIGREASEGDLMEMLRELLTERFHFAGHLESSERPIYALLPEKGGVKLGAEDDDVQRPPLLEGRVLFMARTLKDLCERLGTITGRPVVDQTGLQGRFVIVLTYSSLGVVNNDTANRASDIFTAVREQLGLRLESQRVPVSVLKVDAIEKIPTEN